MNTRHPTLDSLDAREPKLTRVHGDWFITFTGQRVYVNSPDPRHIRVRDIAHALANICRFGGHVDRFYSVAQHSVLVSQHIFPPGFELEGLLHDATEAYVGDVIRPLKRSLSEYRLIESAWEIAIRDRFNLKHPGEHPHDCVKLADHQALVTERRDLLPGAAATIGEWMEDERSIQPWPEPIEPLSPVHAEKLFLRRFADIYRADGAEHHWTDDGGRVK